jgi:hypothetical protein
MGTQYRCSNENRREAVRQKSSLNGIDYLEVSPTDQTTLEVHFIHNLPGQSNGLPTAPALLTRNFVIEGGARVTDIKIKALAVTDNLATLKVDQAGDYSNYVLRLVLGEESSDPPSGFDLQLAALAFSFKVDCPSDFDCQPEDNCPPENFPAPPIDYLAKDYSSFRRLMLDRLATLTPDWQERNPADLQVALVEAVAYVGDYLSYYQDAVATEAYLGTARQRISVRRHARLLDYPMHDGWNARAWVYLPVDQGTPADGWLLPAGTPLLTGGLTGVSTIAPADYEKILKQETPLVFETLHDLTLRNAHNAIAFYTWDDTECCLPKGATRATLQNNPQLSLQAGDVLIFEEVISPLTGLPQDADPTQRWAVRLTGVVTQDSQGQPLVDPLHNIPIAEIAWDAADALPFALCLSAKVPGQSGPRLMLDLSLAHGNIVLADHGQTILNETLGSVSVDAAGRLRELLLAQGPATQQAHARNRLGQPVRDVNNEQLVFDPQGPSTDALNWQDRDPHDVLPAIQLIENGDASRSWRPRRDLLQSKRFERHFVLEVDNDSVAHIRFGDGFHGQVPKPDSSFTAIYRVGNGLAGNVGPEAICRIVLPVAGVQTVRNPLAAVGGVEPEPMGQVRLYGPQAFRTQERAVTLADYGAAAERHPEVQKAVATRRWTGSWNTIFITVDRRGGRLVDEPFKTELIGFLERFRMAGEDLVVDTPLFISLDLEFSICVKPGYYGSQVKQDLLRLFSNQDLPDGRRGFFHPDNLTFGQPVYLSQIIALAMSVAGVQWVDAEDTPGKANRFRRWGQPAQGEFDAGRIDFGRLEVARLDNDPSLPENGKLDFFMEGGL